MIYMINMIPRFSAWDRIVAFRECVGILETRIGGSREGAKARRGPRGSFAPKGLAFHKCVGRAVGRVGGPLPHPGGKRAKAGTDGRDAGGPK